VAGCCTHRGERGAHADDLDGGGGARGGEVPAPVVPQAADPMALRPRHRVVPHPHPPCDPQGTGATERRGSLGGTLAGNDKWCSSSTWGRRCRVREGGWGAPLRTMRETVVPSAASRRLSSTTPSAVPSTSAPSTTGVAVRMSAPSRWHHQTLAMNMVPPPKPGPAHNTDCRHLGGSETQHRKRDKENAVRRAPEKKIAT